MQGEARLDREPNRGCGSWPGAILGINCYTPIHTPQSSHCAPNSRLSRGVMIEWTCADGNADKRGIL
jgi:hypothetical protein